MSAEEGNRDSRIIESQTITFSAYDTRNVLVTPPSPPSTTTTTASMCIDDSWDDQATSEKASQKNIIEEAFIEMSVNDFDPSSSSDIAFSQGHVRTTSHHQSQRNMEEDEEDTVPWNNQLSPVQTTPHLQHASWPDIMMLDFGAPIIVSNDEHENHSTNQNVQQQGQEEEQALLSNSYQKEQSPPLDATVVSDALNIRLNIYKQPCIADNESDTSSMNHEPVPSFLDQAEEEEEVDEEEIDGSSAQDESSLDNYQYLDERSESESLEDLHHEIDEQEYKGIVEIVEGQQVYLETTKDYTMSLNSIPVQLVLEGDDSLPTISLNPSDMNRPIESKSIPLLQPPPDEKLRKWIMSKPELMMTQSSSSSLMAVSRPDNSDKKPCLTTEYFYSKDSYNHEINKDTPSYPNLEYHHSSSCNTSDWANFNLEYTVSEPNIPLNDISSSCFSSCHSLQQQNISHPLLSHYHIPPKQSPSPFELAILNLPSIITMALTFLGDPAAVCNMKRVNRFCYKAITENEHLLMKDAVRLGGLKTTLRPAFWMWITLEKCHRKVMQQDDNALGEDSHSRPLDISEYEKYAIIGKDGKWHERIDSDVAQEVYFLTENECEVSLQKSFRWVSSRSPLDFETLSKSGEDGKWQAVIERDVRRAFGNMPPHKSGARFKADSIVKALVTWGRNRLIKRGVKGGGETSPLRCIGIRKSSGFVPESSPPWESSDCGSDSVASESPTDTVSDWGGISQISPVGSRLDDILGKSAEINDASSHGKNSNANNATEYSEIALCGNGLTSEKKSELQNRLRFILYALSSAHEQVGYCQGMDYVVAHLLRVLQDTIEWKALLGKPFPPLISTTIDKNFEQAKDRAILVEEVVFRVMDTFLTTYGLRHFYWPELRCLKTACRVFEWIVHQKLPVLSDHFEHHELNVGLFALGWFQTLFLYIPAMPSTTINHIWDIFLVERSMKIFFRVATAMLFLSQPILLNHDQEGMMIYLNTFPDATLLKHDILIPCALQIKLTNKMLIEIETRVNRDNDVAHGFEGDIGRSETIEQQQQQQQLCTSCSRTFDCNSLIHAFE